MTKTLLKRSKLLFRFRCFFKGNKSKLYLLTPKQIALLDKWCFCAYEDIPTIWDTNLATELTKCAMVIMRERRKRLTLKGEENYIEVLDIHNTHPKLYRLCLKLRIRTLSELDVFISATRSGSTLSKEFMRQYPLVLDLVGYYDGNRKSFIANKDLQRKRQYR